MERGLAVEKLSLNCTVVLVMRSTSTLGIARTQFDDFTDAIVADVGGGGRIIKRVIFRFILA